MIFKTLPKDLKEEGISLNLLNTINLETGYSPVILQPGDEPAELLRSEKGFFVKDEDNGTYLKDKKGHFYLVNEKECQIGRARFLLKFGVAEKKHKIETTILRWTNEIRAKMTNVRIGKINLDGNTASLLYRTVEDLYDDWIAGDHYSALDKLYKEGQIVKLIQLLSISHTIDDLSIRSGCDGGKDGIRHYAAMHVNKEYPWLAQFDY